MEQQNQLELSWMGRLSLALLVLALLGVAPGCRLAGESASEGDTTVEILPPTAPPFDPDKLVCDPFNPGGEGAREQGILGQLFYRDVGQPRWYSALDYIEKGVQAEVSLFLNRLYVPTRPFDRGFMTQNGQVITTNQGNTLYEYFALGLESELMLAPGEEPGYYELAVISDDGSLLWTQNGSKEWELMIDNDGDHPTRMGCATSPLYVGAGERIPVRLKYYQGPRWHIALTVMWRPWSPAAVAENECGQSGSEHFWDYNQEPPSPTANFTGLIDRGWKVLGDSNFHLPAGVGSNPCNAIPAPTISEVRTPAVGYSSFEVTWLTDIVSTTQVIYSNQSTGETFTTEVNKDMVTSHRQVINGLTANTIYEFSVRSISGSGKVSESAKIAVKTLR